MTVTDAAGRVTPVTHEAPPSSSKLLDRETPDSSTAVSTYRFPQTDLETSSSSNFSISSTTEQPDEPRPKGGDATGRSNLWGHGIAACIRTTKKYAMKKFLAGLALALPLSIATIIGTAAPASADELIAANTYLC